MRVCTMRDASIDVQKSRHVVRVGSDQLTAAALHPFC
jgi:hypothetical protein